MKTGKQQILAILFLITLQFWNSDVKAQGVPESEKQALIALYNATNGNNWNEKLSWLNDPTVENWYGVTVEGGHVTRIDLPANNLVGPIPAAMGNFPELTYLNLGGNDLRGEIPVELSSLASLQALFLDGDFSLTKGGLDGRIPLNLTALPDLTILSLERNNLSGDIPLGFDFNRLTRFGLEANPFSVPDMLRFVRHFGGYDNIPGPIKQNIGRMLINDNRLVKVNEGDPVFLRTYRNGEPELRPDGTTTTTTIDPLTEYRWGTSGPLSDHIVVSDLSPENYNYLLNESASLDLEGEYFVELFHPELKSIIVRRQFSTVQIMNCSRLTVDFEDKDVLCTTLFTPIINNIDTCNILALNWDFGDGNFSQLFNPIHAYASAGSYNVALFVTYQCSGCDVITVGIDRIIDFAPSVPSFVERDVAVRTSSIDDVLNASAVTFQESWPLEFLNQTLDDKNGYLNGREGVWRQNASYVYNVESRSSSTGIDVKNDGVFDLNRFSWQYADLEAVPQWLKVNTVTQYSPFSFELENMDILGRHSGAIYGFNGQLSLGLGQNMKNEEMAVTSFEAPEIMLTGSAGNWAIGENIPAKWHLFSILSGKDNLALVNAPQGNLPDVGGDVQVLAVYFEGDTPRAKYISDLQILCKTPSTDDPDMTYLAFDQIVTTEDWKGLILFFTLGESSTRPDLSTLQAHSGKQSLRVPLGSRIDYKQKQIELEIGKSYLMSGWLSAGNPNALTPDLEAGAGMSLDFFDEDGNELASFDMNPTGGLIEGWRMYRRTFTVPENTDGIKLAFEAGASSDVFFDDIRLHPSEGNMQSFVYDPQDFRLKAVLDENNFATLYFYDEEGNLYLVKKETAEGIKTIQESISHQAVK